MADTKVFIFFVSLAWAIGAFGRPVEISEERDIVVSYPTVYQQQGHVNLSQEKASSVFA